jgi:hypothetical protein
MVVKMDTRLPGYLQVQIEFPLRKALVPQMNVKIKSGGTMLIVLRYENVPHFCFTCGRIGHAAMNCEEEEPEDQGIKFGEELRASPPRRVREIMVRQVVPRVVKPLFQTGAIPVGATCVDYDARCTSRSHGTWPANGAKEGSNKVSADDLATGVHGMSVGNKSETSDRRSHCKVGKE